MLFKNTKTSFFGLGVLIFSLLISACDKIDEILGSSEMASPAISAENVKTDKENLKNFVLAAKKEIETTGKTDFLYKEGQWKHGSVYLFILKPDGQSVLHPANPDLEGQNLMELKDPNGVQIVRELINKANEGGGFVEYLFGHPEQEEGDYPKVSYAVKLDSEKLTASGLNGAVLGSGFYK